MSVLKKFIAVTLYCLGAMAILASAESPFVSPRSQLAFGAALSKLSESCEHILIGNIPDTISGDWMALILNLKNIQTAKDSASKNTWFNGLVDELSALSEKYQTFISVKTRGRVLALALSIRYELLISQQNRKTTYKLDVANRTRAAFAVASFIDKLRLRSLNDVIFEDTVWKLALGTKAKGLGNKVIYESAVQYFKECSCTQVNITSIGEFAFPLTLSPNNVLLFLNK